MIGDGSTPRKCKSNSVLNFLVLCEVVLVLRGQCCIDAVHLGLPVLMRKRHFVKVLSVVANRENFIELHKVAFGPANVQVLTECLLDLETRILEA